MLNVPPALRPLLEREEAARRLGPFVLLEQLGKGGAAPVWLAKEMHGTAELRRAAMKLFSLGAPREKAASAARLRREQIVAEARALCRVEHPNIVRFYALCTDDDLGIIGLAMELVAGVSLDARLADRGKLPIPEVLTVGASIASALTGVHRAGLVHRDVKPANVVDAGGVYKLIDFGIAAAATAGAPAEGPPTKVVLLDDLPLEVAPATTPQLPGALTLGPSTGGSDSYGALAGTPGYIDPACVASGAPPGPASDLYALGVTLFECILGKLPSVAAATGGAGLNQRVLDGTEPAPSLLELDPAVPVPLARLVASLLEADPARRPRSSEWVATELERLRGAALGIQRELPPEEVGPFRGLGRFEAGDRDVYFGRTSEIAAAVELLRTNGVVSLVGASGSGKSSLARAGVVPHVLGGDLGGWPRSWTATVTAPGVDPRGAILAALVESGALPADHGELDPVDLLTHLADRTQTTGCGNLLLLDQLEELVTLSGEASRTWTVDLLIEIGERPLPGLRVLLAIRRDLLDPLLALRSLGKSLLKGMLLVEPIGSRAWQDVLEQALGAYGYAFEDEALEAQVSAELHEAEAAMPLVQFALTELWARRDPDAKRIPRAAVEAVGGIGGALERHADATLARLARGAPTAEAQARGVLLALTTPRGTRATRSAADLDPRPGGVRTEILRELEAARLIVREADGVTLAHESLLVQWGRLRTWVAEARETRLLVEELDREAARWQADPEAPLWSRRRLQNAEELQREGTLDLSSTALAFLSASRRAERRSRWIVRALSIGLVVAAGTGAGAYVRAARAGEAEALEKARSEEQKRRAIETARAEVSEKQATIDRLVQQITEAKDDETVLELQRKLKSAREPASSAEKGAVVRAAPPRPASASRAAASAPPAPPPAAAAAPSLKVQEWD